MAQEQLEKAHWKIRFPMTRLKKLFTDKGLRGIRVTDYFAVLTLPFFANACIRSLLNGFSQRLGCWLSVN